MKNGARPVVGNYIESLRSVAKYKVIDVFEYRPALISYRLRKVDGNFGIGGFIVIGNSDLPDFELLPLDYKPPNNLDDFVPGASVTPKSTFPHIIPIPKSLEDWYRKSMRYVVKR